MSLCKPCYNTLADMPHSRGTAHETVHETIESFLAAVDAKCCICRGLFLQLSEDKRQKLHNYSSPEISPTIWMHSPNDPNNDHNQFVRYSNPGKVTSYKRSRPYPLDGAIYFAIEIMSSQDLYNLSHPVRRPGSMRDELDFGTPAWIGDRNFWTTAHSVCLTPIESKVELQTELRPSSITSDSTFSDETFEKIKTWLNTCANTHDSCNLRRQNTEKERLNAQWLPTRLVEVKPPGQNCNNPSQNMACRIVETQSETIPTPLSYITLSHRWNEHNLETLNRDNLSQWKVEIPPTVSRTFCDAFNVAQTLGISYVWIDSLCIVRQNPEDWKIEAPQMHKVYANAKFNICASRDNNMDGLFSTRLTEPLEMPEIYIAPEDEGTESDDEYQSSDFYQHSGYFLVAKSTPGEMWEQRIQRSPLKDRGWVFQEQLLSSANLHFGSDEVLFECLQMRASESLGVETGYPWRYHTWSAMAFKKQLPMEQGSVSIPESDDRSSIYDEFDDTSSDEAHMGVYERWYSLLSEYSARELTRHEDRLIALSAVAQYFKGSIPGGDIYIAGLWHSRLATDMLWKRRKTTAVVRDDVWAVWKDRSPEFSFSWASITGEIEQSIFNFNHTTQEAKVECISKKSKDQPFVKNIFMVDGSTPIAMKITGRLREISLPPNGENGTPIQHYTDSQACMENPRLAQYYRPLLAPGPINDSELYLIFAAIQDARGPQWTRSIHFKGHAWLDFDISRIELAVLNANNALFSINLASIGISAWFLLLLLVDSEEGTFRRIGVYEGNTDSKHLYCDEGVYNQEMQKGWPLKPLRELPCWRYDEVKKQHTIFVI